MSFISEWFGLIIKVPITVTPPPSGPDFIILKPRQGQGRPTVVLCTCWTTQDKPFSGVLLSLSCSLLLAPSVHTRHSYHLQHMYRPGLECQTMQWCETTATVLDCRRGEHLRVWGSEVQVYEGRWPDRTDVPLIFTSHGGLFISLQSTHYII